MTQDSIVDRRLIDEIASIASRAAAAILSFGLSDLKQRDKADHSPVTAADEASDRIIQDGLRRILPGVPIVSEETVDRIDTRALGARFLLVDPLDGTRELLAGEAEYTINIAMIDAGTPIAGVIAAPALGTIWTGIVGDRAERLRLHPGAAPGEARERIVIRTRARPKDSAIALMSRFHRDAQTDAYLDRFPLFQRVVCGSSIKFCRISEGTADLYVRMTSLSEWDAAAGHALIIAAGGAMTTIEGGAVTYGRPGFRLPAFIVSGDRTAFAPAR